MGLQKNINRKPISFATLIGLLSSQEESQTSCLSESIYDIPNWFPIKFRGTGHDQSVPRYTVHARSDRNPNVKCLYAAGQWSVIILEISWRITNDIAREI